MQEEASLKAMPIPKEEASLKAMPISKRRGFAESNAYCFYNNKKSSEER